MTESEYRAKLKRIDEIFDTDSVELLTLVAEVEEYEREHYPIEENRMTNYERIKSLSLDEMAKSILITFGDCCSACTHFKVGVCDGKTTCVEGIKEWLNKEAKEKRK